MHNLGTLHAVSHEIAIFHLLFVEGLYVFPNFLREIGVLLIHNSIQLFPVGLGHGRTIIGYLLHNAGKLFVLKFSLNYSYS
jgi:hypothetical protein